MQNNTIITFFQRLICAFACVALLLPAITSCHSSQIRNSSLEYAKETIPHRSFVFINIVTRIEAIGCSEKEKKKGCKNFIKKLPIVETKSLGSGIIVNHKKTYGVLTAAHVCEVPNIKETDYQGYKIILEKKDRIFIKFQNGKEEETKILKIDQENDLCLLEKTFDKTLPSVRLAKSQPKRSEKVYNIAAPYGITGNNLTLIFEGYFSGTSGRWFYYTLPARPGSSGSAVLNKKYELVGTLNVAVKNFENVGLGSGLKQIKDFLEKN